jgi:hypothetical protein
VRAKRIPTRQRQRRCPAPAVRDHFPEVIPYREPQSRDALLPRRAAVRVGQVAGPAVRRHGNIVRVDAVVEVEQVLQVGRAGSRGERGGLLVRGGVVALAEPTGLRAGGVDVRLRGAGGVADDEAEVLRDGDLGVADVLGVGAEAHGRDGGVVGAGAGVVEGGDP